MIIDKIKDRLRESGVHASLEQIRIQRKADDEEDPLIVNVRERKYTYWKNAWMSAAHVRHGRRR